MKFSCLIADDNEIDRLTTVAYARAIPFLQIDGVFDSAEALLKSPGATSADVLLLDIDMPGLSGIELRSQLQKVPACIFITSFADYALDSFEVSALDFLVKPLSSDRFARAMMRLREYLTIVQKAALFEYSLGGDVVFIKEGHQQIKIPLFEVMYLEALKDYTSIVTRERKYCVLKPLGRLLEDSPFHKFVRIHRSYAVQKNFIRQIGSKEILVNDIVLPVGRSYKEELVNLR
ncbi:MAG: response regulator transcription factor [Chitinophagaceae bacterium]|nr:response regulator transcription factor [Chitinophagaceae bacterium]